MHVQTTVANKRSHSAKWLLAHFKRTGKKAVAVPHDQLLHDGLSKFERDVIIECREIGMTDDEIQKWMREI